MNYIIVIPSYKRPNLIQSHTLNVLESSNINSIAIYIFVANKKEYNDYKTALKAKYHKNIIIGKKGLKNQRNFISNYFPENVNIVHLDDDIKSINKLTHYNKENRTSNKLKTLNDLNKFIIESFHKCKELNAYLWGVYPINNAYFMFPRMTKDLRFITGPMFGIINRHNKVLKLTVDEKEDTQRTLQYFTLDNIVLRFNNITIDTDYYRNKGGMQFENKNRKASALKSAYYLIKKYPNLTKLDIKKKSGVPEVRLLNRKHTSSKKTKKLKKN